MVVGEVQKRSSEYKDRHVGCVNYQLIFARKAGQTGFTYDLMYLKGGRTYPSSRSRVETYPPTNWLCTIGLKPAALTDDASKRANVVPHTSRAAQARHSPRP